MSNSEATRQASIEERARKLGLQPWQLEMIEAVPDNVMRDIVNDGRRRSPMSPCSPMASESSPKSEPVTRGTGWIDPAPLRPPSGIEHVDALCDQQDREDRAERAAKAAKAAK
jgi:hypothetical protein